MPLSRRELNSKAQMNHPNYVIPPELSQITKNKILGRVDVLRRGSVAGIRATRRRGSRSPSRRSSSPSGRRYSRSPGGRRRSARGAAFNI